MLTVSPPPLSLTILRRGEMLPVDMADLGALIPRSETQVDEAFLHERLADVSQLATPGYGRKRDNTGEASGAERAPERVVHELQRLGGLIFSHISSRNLAATGCARPRHVISSYAWTSN